MAGGVSKTSEPIHAPSQDICMDSPKVFLGLTNDKTKQFDGNPFALNNLQTCLSSAAKPLVSTSVFIHVDGPMWTDSSSRSAVPFRYPK